MEVVKRRRNNSEKQPKNERDQASFQIFYPNKSILYSNKSFRSQRHFPNDTMFLLRETGHF